MGLSASQIGELVRELAPFVLGRTLQEVQAHPPRDVLLILAGSTIAKMPTQKIGIDNPRIAIDLAI